MALPFANPVSECMPGFGSPSFYGAATQTPTTTAALTITIGATATTPSTGGTPFNAQWRPGADVRQVASAHGECDLDHDPGA